MILSLLETVFDFDKKDKITILYDIPSKKDNSEWQERRKIASLWYKTLQKFNLNIAYYNATYKNNADLPNICFTDKEINIDKLFSNTDIVIALTEYSATAPLHYFAKKYGLRVASMPGFNKHMIPALMVDYRTVALKVGIIHEMLKADYARIKFLVKNLEYELKIDLSNRTPLKDDGNCRTKGTVINLPSGEAFIAPFDGKTSETNGFLPIEKNGNVSIYEVLNNKIMSCNNDTELIKKIKQDPAVGNVAELAFGVLGLYGIKSCNKILLDEKLGLHIALGRNDHFGGLTGPASFKFKKNIGHQDYVYIKELQPQISIKEIKLDNTLIMRNNKYVIF